MGAQEEVVTTAKPISFKNTVKLMAMSLFGGDVVNKTAKDMLTRGKVINDNPYDAFRVKKSVTKVIDGIEYDVYFFVEVRIIEQRKVV